ncbi:hypothetical protein GCM10027396_37170 [Insolitispirillum peregrinum]
MIPHANGKAASVPNVPGALGDRPEPSQVTNMSNENETVFRPLSTIGGAGGAGGGACMGMLLNFETV